MADPKMVKFAVLGRLEAKPGLEAEVEAFLKSALPLAQAETDTVSWYALRLGPTTYGIFDTFESDAARQAHLSGHIAVALMARAPELFSKPPELEMVDLLAVKS